jgi:hypothetical protein
MTSAPLSNTTLEPAASARSAVAVTDPASWSLSALWRWTRMETCGDELATSRTASVPLRSEDGQ